MTRRPMPCAAALLCALCLLGPAAHAQSPDDPLALAYEALAQQQTHAAHRHAQKAVASDLQSRDAIAVLALTHHLLGEFDLAAAHYRSLTAQYPWDVDAWLGLGFALGRMGQRDEAWQACLRAAGLNPVHPQVASCQQLAQDRLIVGAEVAAGFYGYTRSLAVTALGYGRVTASLRWRKGPFVWLGSGFTLAAVQPPGDTYRQFSPVLVIGMARPRWSLALGTFGVFANLDGNRGIAGITLNAEAHTRPVGGILHTALSIYGDYRVWQLDPLLSVTPIPRLQLRIGPRVQIFSDFSAAVTGASTGVAGRVSVRASLDLALNDRWTWQARGAIGPSYRPVELQGLSVWTNDDRFAGEAGCTLTWRIHPQVALLLDGSVLLGKAQWGIAQRFQIWGALAGVQLTI